MFKYIHAECIATSVNSYIFRKYNFKNQILIVSDHCVADTARGYREFLANVYIDINENQKRKDRKDSTIKFGN